MISAETTFTLNQIKQMYKQLLDKTITFHEYMTKNFIPAGFHDQHGNDLYAEV